MAGHPELTAVITAAADEATADGRPLSAVVVCGSTRFCAAVKEAATVAAPRARLLDMVGYSEIF